jgi:hypothetical protein
MKGANVIWRLLDNREFDELMSRKLWQEIYDPEDLLEFDY